MSEWRGLANSEWHDPNRRVQGWAWCEGDCNTTCHKDALCRCCLAAEVERLTGALADRDRRIEAVLPWLRSAAKHAGDADRARNLLDLAERALRGVSDE